MLVAVTRCCPAEAAVFLLREQRKVWTLIKIVEAENRESPSWINLSRFWSSYTVQTADVSHCMLHTITNLSFILLTLTDVKWYSSKVRYHTSPKCYCLSLTLTQSLLILMIYWLFFYYLRLLSFCHFQHTCRCYDSFCTLADTCSTQFSWCTHLKACIWKYLQSVSVYKLLLHFMPYLGSWQEMREGESEVHRLTRTADGCRISLPVLKKKIFILKWKNIYLVTSKNIEIRNLVMAISCILFYLVYYDGKCLELF